MYNSRKSASLIEPAQSPFEKEGTEPVSVFCESDYAEVEEVLLFAEDKKIKDPSMGTDSKVMQNAPLPPEMTGEAQVFYLFAALVSDIPATFNTTAITNTSSMPHQ